MTDNILMFATSECPKCKLLGKFLEDNKISFNKLLIDKDEDLRVESVMNNIFSVPAIKNSKGKFMTMQEMFDGGKLNKDEIIGFCRG